MSLANSKKSGQGLHQGFAVAGAVARMRRGAGLGRSGRRAALLGVLTSTYANSSRGAAPAQRTGNNTDRG
jgi:hypothetical protein